MISTDGASLLPGTRAHRAVLLTEASVPAPAHFVLPLILGLRGLSEELVYVAHPATHILRRNCSSASQATISNNCTRIRQQQNKKQSMLTPSTELVMTPEVLKLVAYASKEGVSTYLDVLVDAPGEPLLLDRQQRLAEPVVPRSLHQLDARLGHLVDIADRRHPRAAQILWYRCGSHDLGNSAKQTV